MAVYSQNIRIAIIVCGSWYSHYFHHTILTKVMNSLEENFQFLVVKVVQSVHLDTTEYVCSSRD